MMEIITPESEIRHELVARLRSQIDRRAYAAEMSLDVLRTCVERAIADPLSPSGAAPVQCRRRSFCDE